MNKSELCRYPLVLGVVCSLLAGIIHISGVIEISGRGRYNLKISTEKRITGKENFVLFKELYK